MATYSPPPGTADIFEAEAREWREIERIGAGVFGRYGYGELRTPVFEYTEVFQRGLGGETEVVQKEMYTFTDRGGRSLTLRPEGTAGVMRALSNTDVMNGVEQRVRYFGPMFRGERPAAGRRRQFHQIGVENVGRCAPLIDAECIAMLAAFLREIGLGDFVLDINTRGALDDRGPAEQLLRDYFSKHIDCMCDDCKTRLERNIWRILDCKQSECGKIIAEAPDYVECFTDASKAYFAEVKAALDLLKVPYQVNSRLVRGLDYYVHTVFELTHTALGGQNAIAGGGRYELTVPGFNKPVQGVGFAAGMERLLMVREAAGRMAPPAAGPDVFLLSLGDKALAFNGKLAGDLRNAGISTALEYEAKSMKSQMRSADRLKAAKVLILGDSEIEAGVAVLKNMADGNQIQVPFDQIIATLLQK